jgi:hypothetical protein
MGSHVSLSETLSDLASCLRQISLQLAGYRQGQADIRATQDRHLVLTGQILEAIRSMGKPTEPQPSGLMSILPKVRAWAKDILLVHKLFRLWRAISLPAAGYTLLRWLGLL